MTKNDVLSFFGRVKRSYLNRASRLYDLNTARKMSKYGVFSGPYFPVFIPNTGKYGPEKAAYLKDEEGSSER